jgi:hypothetical protein
MLTPVVDKALDAACRTFYASARLGGCQCGLAALGPMLRRNPVTAASDASIMGIAGRPLHFRDFKLVRWTSAFGRLGASGGARLPAAACR